MISSLIVAAVFIVFGILIKYGKMYFLIAGLNTMSHKQRAQYNLEKIGTLFRNVMFGMALVILLGYFLSKWLEVESIEPILFATAIVIGCVILIARLNSEAYKRRG